MIRKTLFIAIALLGAPKLVHAGDARCLWDKFTPQTQGEIFAAYASQGSSGARRIIEEAFGAIEGAAMTCIASLQTRAQGEKAGRGAYVALAGYATQEASRASLVSRGFSMDRVNAAWDGLAPDERAFVRWVYASLMDSEAIAEQAGEIFGKAVGLAGWTEADGMDTLHLLIDHFQGRAMREGGEQNF